MNQIYQGYEVEPKPLGDTGIILFLVRKLGTDGNPIEKVLAQPDSLDEAKRWIEEQNA